MTVIALSTFINTGNAAWNNHGCCSLPKPPAPPAIRRTGDTFIMLPIPGAHARMAAGTRCLSSTWFDFDGGETCLTRVRALPLVMRFEIIGRWDLFTNRSQGHSQHKAKSCSFYNFQFKQPLTPPAVPALHPASAYAALLRRAPAGWCRLDRIG